MTTSLSGRLLPLLRAYCPGADEATCFALWQATLGDLWVVDRDAFHQATSVHGGADRFANFVAEDDGRIVGFVCAQHGREDEAGVLCVLVALEYRRRGIGRSLVQHALGALAKHGVKQVRVGCGGGAYFCPGVPVNLPGAKTFYESLGWQFGYELYDMTMDLREFQFDERWLARPRALGFEIVRVTPDCVSRLIDFRHTHFPGWWSHFFEDEVKSKPDNFVVAVDRQAQVVGSVSIFVNGQADYDNGMVWRAMLGADMGGFGSVGVREDVRGNGIGLALSAEATRLLVKRGVRTSFVGWTYLEELYGRLGYRIWRRYGMSDARML